MLDDFLIRAAIAGVGAAILAAPLGCFVVWRRMAYFGETIAYSGLLGVALGFLLGIDLTLGVIATAIAMALLLAGFQTQRAIPHDTLLGILAHVALAAGVIAASFAGGARLDLMGYLFGDILAVSKADIAWIWGGAAAVLVALFFLWRPLLAVTVNEELAAAEGVSVRLTETAFILLIAVTAALAMKVIGILLITSLMIFPTAVARPFSKTPEQMAALAARCALRRRCLAAFTSRSGSTRRRGLPSCSRLPHCSFSWLRLRSLCEDVDTRAPCRRWLNHRPVPG